MSLLFNNLMFSGSRGTQIFVSVLLIAFCDLAYTQELGAGSESASSQYLSLAIQGNLSQAASLFNGSSVKIVSETDREIASLFRQRFILGEEPILESSGDAFADAVIKNYRHYWAVALMAQSDDKSNEALLLDSLNKILLKYNVYSDLTDISNSYSAIAAELIKRGFFYINGRTPPLQDLILWKTQSIETHEAVLTDRRQIVKVYFLDDIYSMGWTHFASFGLSTTGGWATDDAVYCVDWAYDRNSEHFKVSYIRHEGRHFADYELYTQLPEVELEYRAKLTELAFAWSSLQRLLDNFTRNAADNPESPHAQANFRVIHDLYMALFHQPFPEHTGKSLWLRVSPEKVNRAARELLEESSKNLAAIEEMDGTQGIRNIQR